MSDDTEGRRVSLRGLFAALQAELLAKLNAGRTVFDHPGAKGEVTEDHWRALLSDYLPNRYKVSKAFVLDVNGRTSDEIDIVIHDRQYSPLVFKQGPAMYLPAESVYGVLEVKQSLNRENVLYAARKAASVRRLEGTSAPIPHAGGQHTPKAPFRILAGVVATGSDWSPLDGDPLRSALASLAEPQRLELGCGVEAGCFSAGFADGPQEVRVCGSEVALVSFFVDLQRRLQQLGTVPALDWGRYAAALGSW